MIQIKLHHFSTWQNNVAPCKHVSRKILMHYGPFGEKLVVYADPWLIEWRLCPRSLWSSLYFLAFMRQNRTNRMLKKYTALSLSLYYSKSCFEKMASVHFKVKKKREGKWNVRHSASGRVKEEYLETFVYTTPVQRYSSFFFFFWYFWKIRQLCICQKCNFFSPIKEIKMTLFSVQVNSLNTGWF